MYTNASLYALVMLFTITGFNPFILAQHNHKNDHELLLENLPESSDVTGFDYAIQLELLDHLIKNPLDLNNVSEEDLEPFFFLNETQKQAIIRHRILYGCYYAVEELQTVAELSHETASRLKIFFYVKAKNSSPLIQNRFWKTGSHTLFIKSKRQLQKTNGFLPDPANNKPLFHGGQNYFSIRYRSQLGKHIKLGMHAENDAGETFEWNKHKKGFDFVSGYIQVSKWKKIESLILGDFTVSMGQGLIMHNGFGAGKSASVMNIFKQGEVLRPYTSINEEGNLRGVSFIMSPANRLKFSIFYSAKKSDASLKKGVADSAQYYINAIQTSGYHRTENEISNKNNVHQQNAGIRATIQINRFAISLNHMSSWFSVPFRKTDELYALYHLSGTTIHNTSADFKGSVRNITFHCEAATGNNFRSAWLAGILIALDKKIDVSLLARNYNKAYQCLQCNAFGESSRSYNENGFFSGIEVRPHHQWKISAYADYWRHPWLKFQVSSPSQGSEYAIKAEHTIKRKLAVYLQYFREVKSLTATTTSQKTAIVTDAFSNKIRLHLNYSTGKNVEIRSRAEWVYYKNGNHYENGYAFFQDILYKPMASSISLTGRYMLFQNQGFSSKIYAYENDILGEYSLPFVSGIGKRAYINLRLSITKNITTEIRYAITKYAYADVQSDDTLNEVQGNIRSEMKVQLKLDF